MLGTVSVVNMCLLTVLEFVSHLLVIFVARTFNLGNDFIVRHIVLKIWHEKASLHFPHLSNSYIMVLICDYNKTIIVYI